MSISALILGAAIIGVVLWDGFETMVLPRRVTRRFRLARLFYRYSWSAWELLAAFLRSERRRENFRAYYAPLSLLLLLSLWAVGLVFGFALLYWGTGGTVQNAIGFGSLMYMSGATFFTLGYGDVVPIDRAVRVLSILETGTGFAFLAILIGHLPGLTQSFSRRETKISLLDSRAGSPPTAFEILRRHSGENGAEAIRQFLHDWEQWAAEVLESHLSYPILAYYRSQHDNQSWLAALASILDASAFIIAASKETCTQQARLTFAMGRHALVDLGLVFAIPPRKPEKDRLLPGDLIALSRMLTGAGIHLREAGEIEQELARLRKMYEPYLYALSRYVHMTLPPWVPRASAPDNWETTAWDDTLPGKKSRPPTPNGRHF